MDKINCNICNSNKYDKIFSIKSSETGEIFDITKCSQCQLVYLNPQPSNEELNKYYLEDKYYSYAEVLKEDQGQLNLIDRVKKIFRKQIFLTYGSNNHDIFQELKKFLYFPFKRRFGGIPAFINKGKLLDVGCGDGLFINELKGLGWLVYGLEIDQETVKRVQGSGLEVRCGRFEDFDFKSQKYDVVRLWHVLEHFKNPNFNLRKISSILKPGGQIILGIPNVNSLYSKIFKQDWSGFDVPRHLYHFSSRTIKKILVECGYSDIKIYYNSVGTGLPSLVTVMNRKIKNKALVNLVFNNAIIRFISIYLDTLLDILRFGGCLEVRAIKK